MLNNIFEQLLDYIELNINQKITDDSAARAANLSPSHLHRLFKFA